MIPQECPLLINQLKPSEKSIFKKGLNEAHWLSWPDLLRCDHHYYYYSGFSQPHHPWMSWTRLVKAVEAFPSLCVRVVFFFNPEGCVLAITSVSPECSTGTCHYGAAGAASPAHIRASSPLSSCPSSVLPSAISSSGITECHFQLPEVMQQRWYLTKHSAHFCCHSNRENMEDLERMRQLGRKAGLFTVQEGHIISAVCFIVCLGRYRIKLVIIVNKGPYL